MDKRIEIIRAALIGFAAEGFNGTSLSKIAEIAGTNKQLINHHFGSKSNLWQEVVDHELEDGVALLRRVLETEKSLGPEAALRQFIEEYVNWVATKTAFQKLMALESQQESPRIDWFIAAHVTPSAKVVTRLIAGCQKAGAVRAGDAGRLYFTIQHIATSPLLNAVQYTVITGRAPTAKSELDYQRAVIFEFLELSPGEVTALAEPETNE